MALIVCTNCGRPYPGEGIAYRCPTCGGVFDFEELPAFDPQDIDRLIPGIWRYRQALGLPESAPPVTLGEGNTPLVIGKAFGKQVAFKLEFLNPSGSFKDRGSAVLASFLRGKGVDSVVEDSSGNAGASLAAYAAKAGIKVQIFIPESASGPKRRQIELYGAEVARIPGSRSNAAEAVLRAVNRQTAYASHAFLPHGIAGYATIAYELFDQLGMAPATVIAPVGQGNLLLGIGRGFQALQRAGLIARLPALYGVQARACSPLWGVFHYGVQGMMLTSEGETLAEGVRVSHPVRGDALLRLVRESGGSILAVDESEILTGRDQLARQGLYVEPTSAIVWDAMHQALDQMTGPVVVILTGSGLKSLV